MHTSFVRRILAVAFLAVTFTGSASAQSLFLERGQRAAEGAIGWSFGPSSDGLETRVSFSLDGRLDLGAGFNRYTLDFDDGTTSTWTELAPHARWFVTKEQDGAPISVALNAQFFIDNFEGDDSGHYMMFGPTLFKAFKLSDAVTIYPFVGFSLVGESYTFGGDTDSQWYLGRQLGVVGTARLGADDRSLLRFEIEETSFRLETYRAARVGYVRRF
jgi:hypothetical protein